MTFLPHRLHFPLLAKELSEMAARRRTYVGRIVYAVLLYAVFFLGSYRSHVTTGANQLYLMGVGREMFRNLIDFQFAGLYVFLPVLMCGAITQEKERDSLVLLFLTDLRPWEIVLQKYASGLVSMASFLLLSTPLAAICYAFGGLSTDDFVTGISLLFLGCLQAGAIILMCSAYCRSTTTAFICSYMIGAALYLGPSLAVSTANWAFSLKDDSREWLVALALFPQSVLSQRWWMRAGSSTTTFMVVRYAAIAVSTLLFLGAARFFLKRRAFVPPRERLLRAFRTIDTAMGRANRLVGGVRFAREGAPFPERNPVGWREVTKKPLGKARYLVRIAVALETLVIMTAVISLHGNSGFSLEGVLALLWCAAFITLGALGANAIVSERVHQTLEVLLTTPVTSREIILQKARTLRRLIGVFFVPIVSIIFLQTWLKNWSTRRYSEETSEIDMVCALLSVLIFLPLVSWISLWVGLKMRTRFRAILTALVIIVAWCVLPLLARLIYANNSPGWPMQWSPAMLVAAQQARELGDLFEHGQPFFANELWTDLLSTFSIYAAALWLIRWHCLRHADRYLRRSFAS
jgi:ABC-type transport system involved in multi-copper enzyme maturation permease subunit